MKTKAIGLYSRFKCTCPDEALSSGIQPLEDNYLGSISHALEQSDRAVVSKWDREADTGLADIGFFMIGAAADAVISHDALVPTIELVVSRILPYCYLRWLGTRLVEMAGMDVVWREAMEEPSDRSLLIVRSRLASTLGDIGIAIAEPDHLAEIVPGFRKCCCCADTATVENLLFGTDLFRTTASRRNERS